MVTRPCTDSSHDPAAAPGGSAGPRDHRARAGAMWRTRRAARPPTRACRSASSRPRRARAAPARPARRPRPASRCVANECRSVCGETWAVSPARSAASLDHSHALCRDSGAPRSAQEQRAASPARAATARAGRASGRRRPPRGRTTRPARSAASPLAAHPQHLAVDDVVDVELHDLATPARRSRRAVRAAPGRAARRACRAPARRAARSTWSIVSAFGSRCACFGGRSRVDGSALDQPSRAGSGGSRAPRTAAARDWMPRPAAARTRAPQRTPATSSGRHRRP